MSSNVTLTLVDGVHIVVPNSLNLITPYVLMEQHDWFEDEIKFLRRLLQPGQQVIDIGANYGVYTLSMAKTVGPTGYVWAFEPASNTADLLMKGIAANKFAHITLERSALSSTAGTAQLSLNVNSELNAVVHDQPTSSASETVPLVTLDECLDRYDWHDIEFVKIDAEGEESNILKGGVRFFADLSPLVQFEIKAGEHLHIELVKSFASLGYDSYRLVPGLDLLVPFDPYSTPDGYLLNLFCCKQDRVKRLAAQGFLLESGATLPTSQTKKFNNCNTYDWYNTIAKFPYGAQLANLWKQTMDAGNSTEVEESLSCYTRSRDSSLPPTERFNALETSFNQIKLLCERQPSNLRLASLARIAKEYGARSVAVNALQQLINSITYLKQVEIREPFLAPLERFDSIPPGENIGNWILAAALEEFELIGSFSSFYTGRPALQRLENIRSLGFGSAEMQRRLSLLQSRFGLPTSVLVTTDKKTEDSVASASLNRRPLKHTETTQQTDTPTIDQMLQQAVAYHQSGQLQDATRLYHTILQAEPNQPDTNYNLGVLAVQMRQPAAGLPYFMTALDADPTRGQYWLNYIDALFQAGQLEDARGVMALAQQQGLQGDDVDALSAHLEEGVRVAAPSTPGSQPPPKESRPVSSTAQQSSKKKLKTNRNKPSAPSPNQRKVPNSQEINTLVAVFNQGRITEAAMLAQTMTERFPLHSFGWQVLGMTHKQAGRNAEALPLMQRAAELSPDDADVHNGLGITFHDLGRLVEAEASLRRALAINESFAEAHSNLGSVLHDFGRMDECEACHRRALQIKPDLAEAHYNLGNILKEQGRQNEAEFSYRRALELKPDHAQAYNNLGVLLNDLRRPDEAEVSLHRALEIQPYCADVHSNLGITLQNMDRLDEAEASYRQALQINPNLAEVHNNLGSVLQDMLRLDEAEASYRRALEINPNYVKAHSSLLFLLNYSPDIAPSLCLAEANQYGKIVADKVKFQFAEWTGDIQPERLRIGFVSGDFKNHPVASFLEGMLAKLDSTSLELIAYQTDNRADEVTERIKPHFSAWKTLFGLNDEAAARLIHSDGVHVLIDLSGHTSHNRLPVFAWKPAPIQASWLGYLSTTGVTSMDYLIADPWTLPESEETHFTETIQRFPETYLCFTPSDEDVAVASLPALTNGYITFGCFNNLAKMNDAVVAVWARVLHNVPDSRLFLKTKQLKDASVRKIIAKRFAAHGIDAQRLMLEGNVPSRTEHLASYNRVDIALDPFPYPGITTSVEGLWMGVPLLTLAGESFLSRQGVGLLMNVGLPEWIATDDDDYVARASSHAHDLQRLAKLRNELRQQVLASPLFDAAKFARHFENAVWEMWKNTTGKVCDTIMQQAALKPEPHSMTSYAPPLQPVSQTIEQAFQQAVACHQAGQLHEAEQHYQAILQTQTNHPEANHNLGVLAVQMKQPAAGLPYFMAALDADPAHGKYWLNYIDALFQAGQLEDARGVLALAQQQGLQGDEVEALALRLKGGAQVAEQPNADDGHTSKEALPVSSAVPRNSHEGPKSKPDKLGKSAGKSAPHKGKTPSPQEINALIALFTAGKLTEAASLAQTLTLRLPRHEFGWKALGAVYKQMGRSADALLPMQKASALSPGDIEAHYNLGVTLQDLGRLDEAEISYQRALQINPNYADALSNLGAIFQKSGRLDEAEMSLRRALKIKPDNAEAHSNLGVTLQSLGRLDEAEASFRHALLLKPDNTAAHSNLGITLQDLCRADEAEVSFRRALQINPDFADAHYNLGITLQDLGRLDEAEASFRRALKIKPDFADVHNTLGAILQELGQLNESETSFRRALEIKPDYAEALNNLGVTLQRLGRLDEAEASFRRALEIKPDFADVYNNLGVTLMEFGRLGEAEISFRRALEIKPDYVDVHNNLGVTLMELGRLDEAETSCRRALVINPGYAKAHSNLGIILQSLGRLDEAEASYRQALQIQPDYAKAHSNLGVTLQSLGRSNEAEASQRSALQINADYAEAHNNLGINLRESGRLEEAEISLRRALKINPDYADAYLNLGAILKDLGRLDEAEASFRRALQIKPDSDIAHSNLLFCRSHNPSVDAQSLYIEHCRFGEQFESHLRANWPEHANSRDPERCLRIGFVSGDLRNHAVAYFIEPVLMHLAGYTQLSLHAYSNHSLDDSVTQRLRQHFAHWDFVYGLSDAALDEKIRADQIDILIDLSGHTSKNRLLTFARKPAPVQVSWMGYPGTTGLRAMDYYLADRFFLPPGQFDGQFTEKIVRLPANAPFLPHPSAPPINILPALSNGYLTFGSFNRLSKLSRPAIALWSQLLRNLPESQMVLAGMPQSGQYDTLIEWFAQEGIARERLSFHERCGLEAYLGLHQHVDICLDTFPYNGGTTTQHALWMGVPTLTLTGEGMSGRVGLAILSRIGLQDFAVASTEDFVARGLYWAENLAKLAELRTALREHLAQSPLRQPEVITAGLETALRSMWQRWCSGLPPESFEVTRQVITDAAPESDK